MEHAIGSIVTLPDGRKAEVVEVLRENGCTSCVFETGKFDCILDDMLDKVGHCHILARTDHKNIIYKEIKDNG